MRFLFYAIFLILISCSNQQGKPSLINSIKIDSSWKQQIISKELNISIPDSIFLETIKDMKSTYGVSAFGLYGVDFYDSVSIYIENQNDFKEALKLFLIHQLNDSSLSHFDLTAIDTTIGNSTGYFVSGYTNDSNQQFKNVFFYLTIANNKYYWFYACQLTPNVTDEVRQFFQFIKFNRKYFKEFEFDLTSTKFHKKAKYINGG